MSRMPLNVMDVPEAARQVKEAAAAKKCWSCGCLHSSLDAIERATPDTGWPRDLIDTLYAAKSRLLEITYDCLGCKVCYPPLAMNALNIDGEACPADDVEARPGWPPLPGSYTALRYRAPIGVCTLTDEDLSGAIAAAGVPELAIVGTCQTENLGIERVIQNVLANPNIRFVVICGVDSRDTIGHLPGQSLLALVQHGVDDHGRIVGARGKRPVLRNLDPGAIEHFRGTVEVIDLIGHTRVSEILRLVAECAARNPGPAEVFRSQRLATTVKGYIPQRTVSDPAGYFVLYVDRVRRLLVLEHYTNDGVLDVVIEGKSAAEVYVPAIERGLVSRLDHAAYLGTELARAEHALESGDKYVQGAAPERQQSTHASCGCGRACGGDER